MEKKSGVVELVLVGGGHSNSLLLKMLHENMGEMIKKQTLKITLINITRYAYYSGMIPGCVSLLYTPQQTMIDLKKFSDLCGIKFVEGTVTSVDSKKKMVHVVLAEEIDTDSAKNEKKNEENNKQISKNSDAQLSLQENIQTENTKEDAERKDDSKDNGNIQTSSRDSSKKTEREVCVSYDLCSIDVGSTIKGQHLEGVKEFGLATRPIYELLHKIEAFESSHPSFSHTPKVVVIGAGAAGIELSWAFKTRFTQFYGDVNVTLVSTTDQLLPEHGSWVRDSVLKKLKSRKINFIAGVELKRAEKDTLHFSDNSTLPYDLFIVATGAYPVPLLNRIDLQKSEDGYILVSDTLQSVTSPFVFASGDCVTIKGYPYVAKAGVYAVREAPILAKNIMQLIKDNTTFSNPSEFNTSNLTKYVPQTGFLALLMTGDGEAISSWKGTAFGGAWIWKLKDWIDRSFMEKFDTKNK